MSRTNQCRRAEWARFSIRASLTLLSAACVPDVARNVSIEPAPAPDVVQFVIRDRNLVYGLSVVTCRGHAVWTISNAELGLVPSRVTYGVTPAGFVSRTGPEPLKPGCYDVIVSGPSRARFNVGEDGRVVSPSQTVVSDRDHAGRPLLRQPEGPSLQSR